MTKQHINVTEHVTFIYLFASIDSFCIQMYFTNKLNKVLLTQKSQKIQFFTQKIYWRNWLGNWWICSIPIAGFELHAENCLQPRTLSHLFSVVSQPISNHFLWQEPRLIGRHHSTLTFQFRKMKSMCTCWKLLLIENPLEASCRKTRKRVHTK